MTVVTRFAPSPTGFLHIGGARTALFNWLFARHHGGKFLLRVEDTDHKRSSQEAIDAIIDGMKWLGLENDGEVYFQSKSEQRHKEIAEQLLQEGKAYHCYCTQEELTEMREKTQAEHKAFRYDGRWRDREPSEAPEGVKPTIRLKAPLTGETVIKDEVQGAITVPNSDLDDMILLRSDGTPTYMLAVVVDDHDMGITHIIRGVDHLTNASRQALIYQAMGWEIPTFAHIPLIHGADGAKMSKRHGALGVDAYRDMGFLPEAVRNYLLRLGWSHGDDEIISTNQAVEWFSLDNVGKSPARFDMAKIESINSHYIKETDNNSLVELITPALEEKTNISLGSIEKNRLIRGMDSLKQRINNLNELTDNSIFYTIKLSGLTEKAEKSLHDGGREIIAKILPKLEGHNTWSHEGIHDLVKAYAEENEMKLGKIAQPLRAALTGSHMSPGVFEIVEILGKEETIARLKSVL